MSVYAIGDVQGCHGALERLLDRIRFDATSDCLWCVGDMVNRGPDSLAVLRLFRELGDRCVVTLGNHDLHLLAAARGHRKVSRGDTLDGVLSASDRDHLLEWLRRLPLVHVDTSLGYAMVHAGIPPQWSLGDALARAEEVHAALRSDDAIDDFLANMYGNEPARWSDALSGPVRLRVITNYFTRMRFCAADGTLDLSAKAGVGSAPPGHLPWFTHPHRKAKHERIVFGHWAALRGEVREPNVFALDTGCVWGQSLTALRLDDGQRWSVKGSSSTG